MGKPKKDKRRQQKEKKAQIAAALTSVKSARECEDPLTSLAAFKVYNRNGLNVTISSAHVARLSSEEIQWAFQLTRTNMKALYDSSEIRWKDHEKHSEMTEDTAIYLMVRNEEKKPVAFVHFRYDLDDDVEVIYCYEIQLDSSVRRKGLGKFLMQILELLAFQSRMKKVVLTVFKNNINAVTFFTKTMKYEIDETSPSNYEGQEDCTYEILSKRIKSKASNTPITATPKTTS